jgi:hypothetical protein
MATEGMGSAVTNTERRPIVSHKVLGRQIAHFATIVANSWENQAGELHIERRWHLIPVSLQAKEAMRRYWDNPSAVKPVFSIFAADALSKVDLRGETLVAFRFKLLGIDEHDAAIGLATSWLQNHDVVKDEMAD